MSQIQIQWVRLPLKYIFQSDGPSDFTVGV